MSDTARIHDDHQAQIKALNAQVQRLASENHALQAELDRLRSAQR